VITFGPFKRLRRPVNDRASGVISHITCDKGECPHKPVIIGGNYRYALYLTANGERVPREASTPRKRILFAAAHVLSTYYCPKCPLRAEQVRSP
jgi:hypothetical protein